MRRVIEHPHYKALPTPKERKEVYCKFIRDRRKWENERARAKVKSNRKNFETMLINNKEITPWTTWS